MWILFAYRNFRNKQQINKYSNNNNTLKHNHTYFLQRQDHSELRLYSMSPYPLRPTRDSHTVTMTIGPKPPRAVCRGASWQWLFCCRASHRFGFSLGRVGRIVLLAGVPRWVGRSLGFCGPCLTGRDGRGSVGMFGPWPLITGFFSHLLNISCLRSSFKVVLDVAWL